MRLLLGCDQNAHRKQRGIDQPLAVAKTTEVGAEKWLKSIIYLHTRTFSFLFVEKLFNFCLDLKRSFLFSIFLVFCKLIGRVS